MISCFAQELKLKLQNAINSKTTEKKSFLVIFELTKLKIFIIYAKLFFIQKKKN